MPTEKKTVEKKAPSEKLRKEADLDKATAKREEGAGGRTSLVTSRPKGKGPQK